MEILEKLGIHIFKTKIYQVSSFILEKVRYLSIYNTINVILGTLISLSACLLIFLVVALITQLQIDQVFLKTLFISGLTTFILPTFLILYTTRRKSIEKLVGIRHLAKTSETEVELEKYIVGTVADFIGSHMPSPKKDRLNKIEDSLVAVAAALEEIIIERQEWPTQTNLNGEKAV